MRRGAARGQDAWLAEHYFLRVLDPSLAATLCSDSDLLARASEIAERVAQMEYDRDKRPVLL